MRQNGVQSDEMQSFSLAGNDDDESNFFCGGG